MITALSHLVQADARAIERAAAALREGGLVAFPTETVYGLGADATNGNAVAAIFAAKGRPSFNPLIVHVADRAAAEALVDFTPQARAMADAFWPGALTLVLPRKDNSPLSLLVSAGLDTVAIRVPSHPVAQQLIATAGKPIAAPSANVSGHVSPTTAAHVAEEFGDKVDFILDGGPTSVGVESTVIGFEAGKPVLLRPGGVSREDIERIAGPLSGPANLAVQSPGQLESHYAPRARLRLNAHDMRPGETMLAFGANAPIGALNLSAAGDLTEAAANLFAMLRMLDKKTEAIAVMPIPNEGLGEAINDRLTPRGSTPAMSDVFSRLKDVVGANGFSEDPREIAPHVEEWRGSYKGHTPLLLKPATTEEVSRVLVICNETSTPIVPQGGNTGLVGGQIPFNGEVLLSLERLNRIRHVDKAGVNMIVEAGAILANVQRAADDAGLLFPLSLASEGSATIGGNLSTNAGGVHVLRYGMARELVLGLEVVLADGRVLDMLRTLRKDNTGYDLKQLFLGAEGTLGVITAAALKLFPAPAETVTAFVAVRDPTDTIALLSHLQSATGGQISAFELVPRIGIELVTAHIPGTSDPLAVPSPWYVLIEATSGAGFDLKRIVEESLSNADLVTDAVIAVSEAQRTALWKLRENMSEAQKKEGPSLKHDIAVPVAAIPDFITKATAAVLKELPDARPVTFGHLGDGNLHFNFNVADVSKRAEIAHIVHDIVHGFGGSISAEHGIGVMKRDELLRYKSAAEIDVMRALKHSLDPKNILNPGKVLSTA